MFWAEIKGKGGHFCGPAQSGTVRCPLILRPTSEDLITATAFTLLRYLPPGRWLPEILNVALKTHEFSYKSYKDLKYGLWENKPAFPRDLLPWREGSTQVDFQLSFENPPTTLFVESKFGSPLSPRVTNDDGSSGYPSDQLIRNVRVGLYECGYYDHGLDLFAPPPKRQFYCILFAPRRGNPLVRRYRNMDRLRAGIPHADRIKAWPQPPFIGELSYRDLGTIIRGFYKQLSPCEQVVARDLITYLDFKRASVPNHSRLKQPTLNYDLPGD